MKKAAGITLMILGWVIAILTLLSAFNSFVKILKFLAFTPRNLGYIFGFLIFNMLFGYFAYWLIKTGIKLAKYKKETDPIVKINSIK